MILQEYENEIKELKERIKKLEAAKVEEPQSKRWTPKFEEYKGYFFVNSDGGVGFNNWYDDVCDNWRYLIGNCFKTREEAEEYKKQIEYTARYKNYIEEHSEPIDWRNKNQVKYYVYFEFLHNTIEVYCNENCKWQGAIYASDKQIIWDAINEIGEDNFKKYVLGVK